MNRLLAVVAVVAVVAASVVLSLAMVSYSASQIGGASPAGTNLVGLAGAYAAHGLITLWGLAAYLVPAIALHWALVLWRENDLPDAGRRIVGAALVIPAACGLAHLVPPGTYGGRLLVSWDQLQLGGLGGALGHLLCAPPSAVVSPPTAGGLLLRTLGTAGAALALTAIAIGGGLLMDLGLGRYARHLLRSLRTIGRSQPVEHLSTAPFIPRDAQGVAKRRHTTSIQAVAQRIERIERREVEVPADVEALVARIREHIRNPDAAPSAPLIDDEATRLTASETARPADPTPPPRPSVPQPAPRTAAIGAAAPAAAPLTAKEAWDAPTDGGTAANAPIPPAAKPAARTMPVAAGSYQLPPVTLLEMRPTRTAAEHQLEVEQTSKAIQEVFASFDISVHIVAATRGPVVTQYEMRLLDQKMRVNKVEGFEKDLSMRLGTEGIRIVAPLPNKTTVGVEVPNRVKEAVSMRDVVEEFDPSQMALPIILGRDAVGRPLVTDLAKAPHLLVAGATGMGKSVCMNAMICSILLFRRPEDVKFIMVDPKMVELAGYEDIPHLLTPPITDMSKAHAALEWACATMDQRYEALKATGVRDIGSFNALGEAEIRTRLAKRSLKLEDLSHDKPKMPYIVVLVDEYADLMMVNKDVEKSIVRLAAKSRACGIHVILTTQRPSADVVTGLIKSNLPSRLCFRVVDKSNSRVVLDVSGAENLLGKGDMLFLQPGTSFPVRGQGVWLKDKEIEAIVEHAKAQGRPDYEEDVVNVGAVAQKGGGNGEAEGASGTAWIADRQFHEAVHAMYRYQRTGADFFRRKMNVGYNRATAFVELLEDLGFVGPQKGTAPREIIKSWDDWIELLKEQGATWSEGDDIYMNPVP